MFEVFEIIFFLEIQVIKNISIEFLTKSSLEVIAT